MLVCTINLDVDALVGVNTSLFSPPAAVGCLWRVGSCTPLLDLQLLLFWYVSVLRCPVLFILLQYFDIILIVYRENTKCIQISVMIMVYNL